MKTCNCGKPFIHQSGGESTTLVAFHSPRGHNHDDNCVKRIYMCENSHATIVSKRNRCHACDWVGKSECGCHCGQKVDEWPSVQRPDFSDFGSFEGGQS